MLGFPRALHAAPDAPNAFVHDVSALRDFLADTCRDDATVQVPIPKVLPPLPPPSDALPLGPNALDESASMKAKRIALQRKGAAAMIVAEEYARRFESNDVVCGENEGSEKAQKMLSCKSCGKLKKNILYTPGKLEKMLDVKCLIEKEHFILARNPLGGSSLLPIWYSTPPFRIHHQAKHRMEFEWDNEYGSGSSKIMKLTITYQPDGRYLIETEHNGSPVLEVKSTYVKDNYFRVEAAGAINDVNVAVYSKVSAFLYSLCGLI
ncbi:hypothetical protein GYH30_040170 [Glycine max]|nr:hypothetical protein GYH30_040170 [Glycine max]